jgi:outer membrane immunogenic protein
MRSTGGMFGGQAGYNIQNNWLVFGIELKGDWTNLTNTQVGGVSPSFPSDAFATKLQDLETLSMRLGYAPANWLFYGEVGAASATIQLNALSGPPVSNVAFSDTQRVGGFALGGGIESLWAGHFILGVEYQYVVLSDSIHRSAFCNGPAPCVGVGAAGTPVTISGDPFRVQSVVARASYKF